MKKQMNLFVIGLVALVSVPGIAAGDTTRRFSCLINKLNTLDIEVKSVDGEIREVDLQTRIFSGEREEHVVTLSKPMLRVIEYGNVMMVQEDFGRSGYVFLRFEKKSATHYDGLIDVSYFQNRSFNTGGNLISLPCFSYES
ncbi:MAG TPA: hypothetical protein DCS07_03290 [Bdellovibrionales bacterium]|nr:MAG: hypothetical protein A2Z97_03720 [Bdellovibrionales bacterium GWB1_52_6]OFZ06365.1 MAG: hypothetical protein A2X97_02785 [Bdellovibrionales bacterium GWA1_52_35]OFZ38279.1 MAG: hypothetical protein A2070_13360 [Bdellovibrionales bacterium GWC1_52_8]HAR41646.1 hypothetical protein [Bdellovibrionales bacterium]HCM40118.1 hypothetical protein [Bdellovibrionales bacterium]